MVSAEHIRQSRLSGRLVTTNARSREGLGSGRLAALLFYDRAACWSKYTSYGCTGVGTAARPTHTLTSLVAHTSGTVGKIPRQRICLFWPTLGGGKGQCQEHVSTPLTPRASHTALFPDASEQRQTPSSSRPFSAVRWFATGDVAYREFRQ